MTTEPDYTLTIVQEAGGWVVCEGGAKISNPIADRAEAEQWLDYHRRHRQPWCVLCGSSVNRGPDDPWEDAQVSRSETFWTHKSCMEKVLSWLADDERNKLQPIPSMEVLDAAWRKKHL
jgi:ferric-dicitrate binding protein FerR (iron transport regulator)